MCPRSPNLNAKKNTYISASRDTREEGENFFSFPFLLNIKGQAINE